MAKLNGITVLGEVISKDGQQYAASTKQAVKGDIIRVNRSDSDRPTIGAYYEVDYVDSVDDAQITVEDGESFDTVGDDLTVYKPLKTPVSFTDAIVHNGATYRKIARKAQAGELIVFTSNTGSRFTGSVEGAVYTVSHREKDSQDDFVRLTNGYGIFDTRYSVLEPLNTSTRLTVGDYAKIVKQSPNRIDAHHYVIGSFVTIVTDDGSDLPYIAKQADGERGKWLYPDEVVRATKADYDAAVEALEPKPTPRLPFGSYAKITGDGEGRGDFGAHGFDIGAIVEVTVHLCTYADRVGAKLTGSNGHGDNYWFVHNDDLVAVEKPDTRLAVGSYVKVIDDTDSYDNKRPNVTLNEIRKLIRDDEDNLPYVAKKLDDSRVDFFREKQLVAATEAESAKATELAAETAKWSAIGRKVSEFKNGDIVKVVNRTRVVPVNTVGVVGEVRNGSFRVNTPQYDHGNWHSAGDVELVAPVESIFSAKAA